jgi:Rieske Fe-S protein
MSDTTRRAVLVGAVAAGAAVAVAAVAACGGSSDSGSGTGGNGQQGGTSQPPTSETTGGQATGGGLTTTGDIPVGGGKIFEAQKVVVTQPTAGQFKAFSAICTHMGCTVGTVSNGLIQCPCHGSTYSVQDGSVKGGPAPKPLAAKQVTVTGDEISVAG